ncbi:UDP-N-acetylgalactosamine-undecaprenyl-phosphate N-acetylgalactosaminephosphotransferase [Lachnospiraceae bacterium]|nr:UDP-N-acetylgalactosamine-undecaprenyl-phosphate N-acetylgalactosaminephosphotransferase [Lachnospiraceae bacterium]
MGQKHKIVEVYGLWFVDLVAIGISFALATYIRFGNFRDMEDKTVHFQVCLVFLFFCTIYSFFLDWNRNFLKRGIRKEAYEIVKYNGVMVLVTQTIMFFLKWADVFPRLVMIYFPVINTLLTLLAHLLVKNGMRTYYHFETSRIKMLVITQEGMASDVLEQLQDQLDINYQIVAAACLPDKKEEEISRKKDIDGIPILWIGGRFMEEVTLMAVDEVFIYAPEVRQKQIQEILKGFDEMGVNCHYCLELSGIQKERSKIENFGGYSVITYTRFQSSYKRLLVKRLMDIAGGLVGLAITGVLSPFIALAIKLDSPGPALFSQIRIGRNGRRFKIYKFRSMYTDAEERKKELEGENEMQGLMFKMENDPRITKVGKFIRKTSIDELPQFFNVVRGDMSLVGTRPPTADEFEKYNKYYRRRISMTPGLTGLWQVSGRSEIEDFDDVVKYDLEYIDNWSLTLDMKILLRTVWVVIAGRGSK